MKRVYIVAAVVAGFLAFCGGVAGICYITDQQEQTQYNQLKADLRDRATAFGQRLGTERATLLLARIENGVDNLADLEREYAQALSDNAGEDVREGIVHRYLSATVQVQKNISTFWEESDAEHGRLLDLNLHIRMTHLYRALADQTELDKIVTAHDRLLTPIQQFSQKIEQLKKVQNANIQARRAVGAVNADMEQDEMLNAIETVLTSKAG